MMKKKWLMGIALVLTVCLLGGCSSSAAGLSGLGGGLRALVRYDNEISQRSGSGADTVTISREEYERYRQLDTLLELKDIVGEWYYQDPGDVNLIDGACAGLLSALEDPYTFYYTAEEWQKMLEDDEGKYAGVGIMISANYKTNLCTITRVFKGSPAEAAGVRKGDILYRVGEDLYVTAETLQSAVDVMRGTPGTKVDVTFLRDGEEITFNLERADIVVNQVEETMLTDDIALIALYEFSSQSGPEFVTAFEKLRNRGAKGLIIDLRDNPGGWVEAAQTIGDLFLDEGNLCYLVYRGQEPEPDYPTKDGKTDIPLVILVNENSASASEILTGALRERAGATVVGVQSYGKGIVQAVLPIGDSGAGFQITVAEYLTPDQNHVHKVGLAPDVEVPLEEGDNGDYDFGDAEHDPQLKKALEIMIEKMK